MLEKMTSLRNPLHSLRASPRSYFSPAVAASLACLRIRVRVAGGRGRGLLLGLGFRLWVKVGRGDGSRLRAEEEV